MDGRPNALFSNSKCLKGLRARLPWCKLSGLSDFRYVKSRYFLLYLSRIIGIISSVEKFSIDNFDFSILILNGDRY